MLQSVVGHLLCLQRGGKKRRRRGEEEEKEKGGKERKGGPPLPSRGKNPQPPQHTHHDFHPQVPLHCIIRTSNCSSLEHQALCQHCLDDLFAAYMSAACHSGPRQIIYDHAYCSACLLPSKTRHISRSLAPKRQRLRRKQTQHSKMRSPPRQPPSLVVAALLSFRACRWLQ